MTTWSPGALAATLICALAVATGAAGASLGGVPPAAAADPPREYLIKAAFLYNFAKFTEWPVAALPDSSTSLQVCVLGQDPFGPALESIAGKPVKGRVVAVRRIAAAEAAGGCHLVFVSASEEARLASVLRALSGQPVLTIADMPDFARSGGIITLKTNKEEKIRFEINVRVAKRVGLRISSRLLNLADLTPN